MDRFPSKGGILFPAKTGYSSAERPLHFGFRLFGRHSAAKRRDRDSLTPKMAAMNMMIGNWHLHDEPLCSFA